jgi:Bacterial low temperature requirement A protein (LtrA)
VYRELHKNRPKARRTAVNVEAMVEKYGVLTLIVLGESLLALLIQGADLVEEPEASIGLMFLATAASVLIVYSMQTIYFNVDQNLGKGSVHAIRHMALAGFVPTGLAKLIKEITLHDKSGPPSYVRELFSVGWGASFVISGFFSLLHKAGPRERTRNHRICGRIIIVLAVAIGVPFADISAGYQLLIFTLVSAVVAVVEFVLLEADRIGMLVGRPIPSTAPSSIDHSGKDSQESVVDDDDNSSEMDPDEDIEEVRPGDSAYVARDANVSTITHRRARREARRRQRRFGCKFEVVCQQHKAKKVVCGEQS